MIFSNTDENTYRRTPCEAKISYKNQFYAVKRTESAFVPVLLDIIAAEFKVKTFGFFLVPMGRGFRWNAQTTAITSKMAKNKNGFQLSQALIRWNLNEFKYLESYLPGYIRYFIINPNVGEQAINVEAGAANSKIKSAFMKNNKNKKFSRILVSKFMELAA